jgi:hypothetical protein
VKETLEAIRKGLLSLSFGAAGNHNQLQHSLIQALNHVTNAAQLLEEKEQQEKAVLTASLKPARDFQENQLTSLGRESVPAGTCEIIDSEAAARPRRFFRTSLTSH